MSSWALPIARPVIAQPWLVAVEKTVMQHFLDISYRAQEHVLVARWMQQMRTDSNFEAGYHYLLTLARQHSCPFWLLDVRRCSPTAT